MYTKGLSRGSFIRVRGKYPAREMTARDRIISVDVTSGKEGESQAIRKSGTILTFYAEKKCGISFLITPPRTHPTTTEHRFFKLHLRRATYELSNTSGCIRCVPAKGYLISFAVLLT